jgi:hypothetical protein
MSYARFFRWLKTPHREPARAALLAPSSFGTRIVYFPDRVFPYPDPSARSLKGLDFIANNEFIEQSVFDHVIGVIGIDDGYQHEGNLPLFIK